MPAPPPLPPRPSDAEAQYSTCVRACVRSVGELDSATAMALTDLTAVLREQNKLAEAEVFARRAVASLQGGAGTDDFSTATALYNLAG